MNTVHFLRHVEEKHENAPYTYKTIGVYSTVENARAALRRHANLPGFRDYPERWRICAMTLDREHDWHEGYDSKTHERLGSASAGTGRR